MHPCITTTPQGPVYALLVGGVDGSQSLQHVIGASTLPTQPHLPGLVYPLKGHLIVPYSLMKLNDTAGHGAGPGGSLGPVVVIEPPSLASCSDGKAEWPPGQQLTWLLLFVSGP